MKKYLFETLFAISLVGVFALVYYLTPFAEKQMDVVVVDKFINLASEHNPYRVEICEVANANNCTMLYQQSHRLWQEIEVGEHWTMMVAPYDKLSGQEQRFTLSIIFSICAAFFIAIILANTLTKELTKNVQS